MQDLEMISFRWIGMALFHGNLAGRETSENWWGGVSEGSVLLLKSSSQHGLHLPDMVSGLARIHIQIWPEFSLRSQLVL